MCTDVGGSREVVSEGNAVYGRLVPPKNPLALARAQLELLAMLDGIGTENMKELFGKVTHPWCC